MLAKSLIVFITLLMSVRLQSAESYILIDGTGSVLAKKNENAVRPVASLTKLAMALVVLEQQNTYPDTTLISVPSAALVGGANPLSLRVGDKLSITHALHAAILGSDNVSAFSLADHFGEVNEFVAKMNTLAKLLGMDDTTFINPHGLDLPDKQGKSTASDMAKLGLAATDNNAFMAICGKSKSTVKVNRNGKTITKTVSNTNHILGQNGVDGMKTGTTRRAGACFIGSAVVEGKRYICVVLKSNDRFADTKKLLQRN